MEQLLLYQMDMDGMASIWQMYLRFQHLSEPGTSWRSGEAHSPLFFTSAGRAACRSATVHSLLSAHWKLRSRKQHSPKAKSPNTRKGQGSDECKLNGQGGRDAAS